MSQDRREFLGAMLAAGLVPELVAGTGGLELPDFPPPGAAFVGSDFDLSWTSRLTGRFRGVFDWPQPDAWAGLWRAGVWRKQVIDNLGATPNEVNAILVIRHSAIPMIMGDEFWARHKLGKLRKLKDPNSGKTATRNPHIAAPGATASEGQIDGFIKSGGIVLACGFAFGFMVSLEAKAQGKSAGDVRPEVLKEVVPGVLIQPSGFFALLEAQRNGCGLFPADL